MMKKRENILNLNEEKELKDFAPNLSKIEKRNPFVVPDNYFDKLQNSIQEKCKAKENKSFFGRYFAFVIKLQYSFVISLIVIAVIFVSYFVYKQYSNEKNLSNNYLISWQDVVNYEDLNDDIDESTLVETLLSEKQNNLTKNNNYIDVNNSLINDTNISTNDVIDYLNGEDYNN